MPISPTNLAIVMASQHAAATAHETVRPLTRRYRALAAAQRLQADKAEALLAALGHTPEVPDDVDPDALTDLMPDMIMTAARERQAAAESMLIQTMKAITSHNALTRADTDADSYHVCMVCGFISADTPPERCPVCRAQAARFQAVT